MNAIKYRILPLVLFLTACAPTPRPAEEPPTNKIVPLTQRKAETATVSSWDIKGAIAAKSKVKAWSASINWAQHGPNSYQIRLLGPLGGGTVLISKAGNTVTIQDGTQKTSSTNADELLLKKTGIRLPVNSLYYWVRGLPAPGKVQAEQHDQYNHLTHLEQSGYLIDFNQFTSVKGIDLPSSIRLVGHGVLIKVIIKQWSA